MMSPKKLASKITYLRKRLTELDDAILSTERRNVINLDNKSEITSLTTKQAELSKLIAKPFSENIPCNVAKQAERVRSELAKDGIDGLSLDQFIRNSMEGGSVEPSELESGEFVQRYLRDEEVEGVEAEREEEDEKDWWGRYEEKEEYLLRRCRRGKLY